MLKLPKEFVARGVEAVRFPYSKPGAQFRPEATVGSVGRTPDTAATFPCYVRDPDGNTLAVPGNHNPVARTWTQQFGRLDADRAFA